MKQKFIKLFEEHTADTAPTWTDIRDTIQMKRPFVIIVFRTVASFKEAVASYFSETSYIKQTAIINNNGEATKYLSIFLAVDLDKDYRSEVKSIYEKFDIKQIIVGKSGAEYSTLYAQDGTSSDFGNEIVSTLSSDEFSTEDQFKIGSTYYHFIEFEG